MSGIDPINDLALMMTSFVKTIKIILKLVEIFSLNNKNLTKLLCDQIQPKAP
jgi:hypothetical protein